MQSAESKFGALGVSPSVECVFNYRDLCLFVGDIHQELAWSISPMQHGGSSFACDFPLYLSK